MLQTALRTPGLLLRSGPIFDWDFRTLRLPTEMSIVRSNAGTTRLYTDASGAAYSSIAANLPRFITSRGLLLEGQKTSRVLNSAAPVTQTTASLATGTYNLWVNGPGSATVAAATAVGTGFGTATHGVPVAFTLSVAGTVLVTVVGSLTSLQLENSEDPTSFIETTGSVVTRGAEHAYMPLSTTDACSFAITAESTEPMPITATGARAPLALGSDNASNYFGCRMQASNDLISGINVTPARTNAITGTASMIRNTPFVFAASATGGRIIQGFRGASSSNGGAPAVWDKRYLFLNSLTIAGTSNGCRMIVRRVRVWNRSLSVSEMLELDL